MTLAVLLALLAGCASEPDPDRQVGPSPRSAGSEAVRTSFSDLDADDDRGIEGEEFVQAALRYYDDWDLDEDGRMTEDELIHGMFRAWDEDGSGRIGRDEHEAGMALFFPASPAPAFWSWDLDGNGRLGRVEVRAGLREAGVFRAYDANADGSISDLELSDLMFSYWDSDGDGRLNAREWRLN